MNTSTIELLSPASNAEAGILAINAGADAVYIGPPGFGARAKATNSVADIARLVRHAHIFNARVFATLNTILYDDELESARRLAWELYEVGVDAFIVQDMAWLKMELPPVELHASTQTDNRTIEKVQFLERLGFSRVVLARELSLADIKAIRAKTSIELETFIHGSLCVCYSGQCYLSAYLAGRSANRGDCSQPCRLPYDLVDDCGTLLAKGQHLLSLKDLNLTNRLEELIAAGVTSLKIEGRLKSAQYTQNITAHYDQALKRIAQKSGRFTRVARGNVELDWTPNPLHSFSRPHTEYFAAGRLLELTSPETPKSLGERVGEVSAVGMGWFELVGGVPLSNGDGLCLVGEEGVMGVRANRVEGARVFLYGEMPRVRPGDAVYRNANRRATEQIEKNPPERYLQATFHLDCKSLDSIILHLIDEEGLWVSIPVEEPVEPARDAARQREIWRRQLSRSHDSRVRIGEVKITGEQIPFLPIAAINAFRRRATDQLIEVRAARRGGDFSSVATGLALYPSALPSDYRLNVVNQLSKAFYESCGVEHVEMSPEALGEFQGGEELMRTRFCLRFEQGLCPREGGDISNRPLFLRYNGRLLKASFDCTRCEMILQAAETAGQPNF